jgi:RNA polymerase sigma factor (sigma-70 family)
MIPFEPEFIEICKKGDKSAQKQLFERLYSAMFRICLRYVNQQAEAEDCLMRGFMKSFRNLDKFSYQLPTDLYFWVRRIMINESLMALRKKNNFMLSIEEDLTEEPAADPVLGSLEAAELAMLIAQLPAGYRTVFNLYVVEGYDHREIASLLGISESTSRTQLAKARKKLQLSLTSLYPEYENTAR